MTESNQDQPTPRISSLLIKPVSADCNLACEYCFYHGRSTDPYQGKPKHKMDNRVLAAMISQFMKMAGPNPCFSWQGGEPLLCDVDFFKRVTEYQMKYGRSGQFVGNAFQTNATLITPEWAELFNKYKFLLGVSVDGPLELHDHYRRYHGGQGSFERIQQSIAILREHHVEFNILAVVNDLTAQHPEKIYEYFLNEGIYFLQFIPANDIDPETGLPTPYSVQPKPYGEFLCRLFDVWFNDGSPQASIRFFDNVLQAYVGLPAEVCEMKSYCGEYVVIEYNGDVYPCDFYVERQWHLGNIMQTGLEAIVKAKKTHRFARQKGADFPECRKCRWRSLCHTGCPRLRLFGGKYERRNYLCESLRRFFEHTEDRFQHLKRNVMADPSVQQRLRSGQYTQR